MAEESQTNTDGSYLSLFFFLGVTIFYYVSGLKPSMTLAEIKTPPTLDENGNLVGANTMNFENREVVDETERKRYEDELFERNSQPKSSV